MKLTNRSSMKDVARSVASALDAQGISAVLTGGACATVYTEGRYKSADLDFVLMGQVSRQKLDTSMKSIGFAREGNQYINPVVRFIVEFPSGPLAIGGDFEIAPVEHRFKGTKILTLSATDSCRDRLAAFYHWHDRQSLGVAAGIARCHRLNLRKVRQWSEDEGHQKGFEEFLKEVSSNHPARGRQARPKGR